MTIDYRLMLARLRPTSEYHWMGGQIGIEDSYASIGEWRDALTTKPTEAEIIAEWDKYLVEKAANDLLLQQKATAEATATTGYTTLPDFVRTMTADEAVTHIHTSILNGQTAAQIDAAIDAQILDITTASIAQINLRLAAIRGVLKTAAGAIIAMRDLFELIAKLLIYIRDLVIRFKNVVHLIR